MCIVSTTNTPRSLVKFWFRSKWTLSWWQWNHNVQFIGNFKTWCHLISSSSGCRLNRVHLDVHAEHSDMPPGMSPRLDHMYVWYNHVHYQPPSCCMASLQHPPPYCPMVPLQCRPSGCHHGTTAASTTWLSPRHHSSVDHLAVTTAPLQRRPPGCHHGTTPASTIRLSPRHHSSVDHLAVTTAPLQRRPPGCHLGTTPASTTWLSPWCHSCTAPDFSTLPHDGDHRRSRTSPHLSPLSPVPHGMAHSSMWRCLWECCGCVWELSPAKF